MPRYTARSKSGTAKASKNKNNNDEADINDQDQAPGESQELSAVAESQVQSTTIENTTSEQKPVELVYLNETQQYILQCIYHLQDYMQPNEDGTSPSRHIHLDDKNHISNDLYSISSQLSSVYPLRDTLMLSSSFLPLLPFPLRRFLTPANLTALLSPLDTKEHTPKQTRPASSRIRQRQPPTDAITSPLDFLENQLLTVQFHLTLLSCLLTLSFHPPRVLSPRVWPHAEFLHPQAVISLPLTNSGHLLLPVLFNIKPNFPSSSFSRYFRTIHRYTDPSELFDENFNVKPKSARLNAKADIPYLSDSSRCQLVADIISSFSPLSNLDLDDQLFTAVSSSTLPPSPLSLSSIPTNLPYRQMASIFPTIASNLTALDYSVPSIAAQCEPLSLSNLLSVTGLGDLTTSQQSNNEQGNGDTGMTSQTHTTNDGFSSQVSATANSTPLSSKALPNFSPLELSVYFDTIIGSMYPLTNNVHQVTQIEPFLWCEIVFLSLLTERLPPPSGPTAAMYWSRTVTTLSSATTKLLSTPDASLLPTSTSSFWTRFEQILTDVQSEQNPSTSAEQDSSTQPISQSQDASTPAVPVKRGRKPGKTQTQTPSSLSTTVPRVDCDISMLCDCVYPIADIHDHSSSHKTQCFTPSLPLARRFAQLPFVDDCAHVVDPPSIESSFSLSVPIVAGSPSEPNPTIWNRDTSFLHCPPSQIISHYRLISSTPQTSLSQSVSPSDSSSSTDPSKSDQLFSSSSLPVSLPTQHTSQSLFLVYKYIALIKSQFAFSQQLHVDLGIAIDSDTTTASPLASPFSSSLPSLHELIRHPIISRDETFFRRFFPSPEILVTRVVTYFMALCHEYQALIECKQQTVPRRRGKPPNSDTPTPLPEPQISPISALGSTPAGATSSPSTASGIPALPSKIIRYNQPQRAVALEAVTSFEFAHPLIKRVWNALEHGVHIELLQHATAIINGTSSSNNDLVDVSNLTMPCEWRNCDVSSLPYPQAVQILLLIPRDVLLAWLGIVKQNQLSHSALHHTIALRYRLPPFSIATMQIGKDEKTQQPLSQTDLHAQEVATPSAQSRSISPVHADLDPQSDIPTINNQLQSQNEEHSQDYSDDDDDELANLLADASALLESNNQLFSNLGESSSSRPGLNHIPKTDHSSGHQSHLRRRTLSPLRQVSSSFQRTINAPAVANTTDQLPSATATASSSSFTSLHDENSAFNAEEVASFVNNTTPMDSIQNQVQIVAFQSKMQHDFLQLRRQQGQEALQRALADEPDALLDGTSHFSPPNQQFMSPFSESKHTGGGGTKRKQNVFSPPPANKKSRNILEQILSSRMSFGSDTHSIQSGVGDSVTLASPSPKHRDDDDDDDMFLQHSHRQKQRAAASLRLSLDGGANCNSSAVDSSSNNKTDNPFSTQQIASMSKSLFGEYSSAHVGATHSQQLEIVAQYQAKRRAEKEQALHQQRTEMEKKQHALNPAAFYLQQQAVHFNLVSDSLQTPNNKAQQSISKTSDDGVQAGNIWELLESKQVGDRFDAKYNLLQGDDDDDDDDENNIHSDR